MNVQEHKDNTKKKCNERNDENKNQNKWEKLMKNLKMNENSQRIQVESAERNNNVVIAEKKEK